jgi:hypothetical protein
VMGRLLAGLGLLSTAWFAAGGDPFGAAVVSAACLAVIAASIVTNRALALRRAGWLSPSQQERGIPGLVHFVRSDTDCPVTLTVLRR